MRARNGRALVWLLTVVGLCACTLRQPDTALTLAPESLGTPISTAIQTTPTRARIPPLPPTLAASATPTLTRETFPSTFTPLPRRNQTEVAQLLASPRPRRILPATWTAAPTQLPTVTALQPEQPPAQATAPPQGLGATLTPSPTATRIQPTVAVRYDLLPTAIPPPVQQPSSFSISSASAFTYEVAAGQPVAISDVALRDGLRLYAPNPADSSSYLYTDSKGILRYRPPGAGQAAEMSWSPFHAGYSAGIDSIERNKHRIAELDWSADGQRFSFRIDTPPGLDNSAAGVWHWQPQPDPVHGATFQLIRDCAHDGYRPCHFVNASNAAHWKTIETQWSPIAGDNRMLLTLQLPEEGRKALALVEAVDDPAYANNAPRMVRYDYGHWDADGRSITVSGRRADGRVVIAQVDAQLGGERVLLDGTALGLWLRDAARLPDGRVYALGRPGAPGSGPLALYDQQGRRRSDFVGDSAPEHARWTADRSLIVLSLSGRQLALRVSDGAVIDASDLSSRPHFSQQGFAAPQIPAAVIQGAQFYPGQQLRVIVAGLNIRQSPGTDASVIGGLVAGDYVAVFAGPYDNQGYRWWRVQTAQDRFGWIAGAVGDSPTVAPA